MIIIIKNRYKDYVNNYNKKLFIFILKNDGNEFI